MEENLLLDETSLVTKLRNINSELPYAPHLQHQFCNETNLSHLIDILFEDDSSKVAKKLILQFCINVSVNSKSNQEAVFHFFFSDKLVDLVKNNQSDKQLLKFVCILFHKIFLLNVSNFKNRQPYLANMLSVIFGTDTSSGADEDKELSEWLVILVEFVMSTTDESAGQTFLEWLISEGDSELVFNLMYLARDLVELKKNIEEIEISDVFLGFVEDRFELCLNKIHEALDNDVKEYEYYFRHFIHVSDILAILNIKKFVKSRISLECVETLLLPLFKLTDGVYDKFARYKPIGDKMGEDNLLYGFQSNLMKFLSNYSWKNESLKQFFITNPDDFYYLLSHMKIDRCNPFKKEYTSLLIKSLCEGFALNRLL